MTIFLKWFARAVWNSLAVIGIFAIVGGSIGFFVFARHIGLSPKMLADKIVEKTMGTIFSESVNSSLAPVVNPTDYPPVDLSPWVSTVPYDENLYFHRRILHVGPERQIKKPSDAAKIAEEGNIIEIDAGLYTGDVALWHKPNLLIRGVGGRAIIDADGRSIEGKAIWVVRADNITIENMGFINCRVGDQNGAGIRLEGDSVTIRNCLFRKNENGFLCGNLNNIHQLTVEYSEFAFNGIGDGQTHAIYIGDIDNFIFQFNYVHHTISGHHVKSRAHVNNIRYNYLTDGDDGNASYAIDLPDCGKAYIVGNILHQSKYTENSALIHYGMPNSPKGEVFYIVNNTASSARHTGLFMLNHSKAKGMLSNNLLLGKLDIGSGKIDGHSNVHAKTECVLSTPSFPFSIGPDCKAVDTGSLLKNVAPIDLTPQFEYVHPLSRRHRNIAGKIDTGAFECMN